MDEIALQSASSRPIDRDPKASADLMSSEEESAAFSKVLQSAYAYVSAYAPALYRLIKLLTLFAVLIAMLWSLWNLK